jgi:secreted trypsin-like serine protease
VRAHLKIKIYFLSTAAHCFHNKRVKKATASQEIIALLGKHDLNVIEEEGSLTLDVIDLILHEDWNPSASDFDADISLVVLKTEVNFSNPRIKIVCLPPASELPVTGIGRVAGWGISERSVADGEYHDSKPNELELPAVTRDQCAEADKDLDVASSDRTFCAGFLNQNKSACKGDSGGGFYLYDNSKRIFNLAGIVSASLNDPAGDCRVDIFSIFTDVTKYIEWIAKKMEVTMEVQWKAVEF